MAEFAKYYVDFLWSIIQNIGAFFYTIGYAFYKFFILDVGGYFTQLSERVGDFDALGWVFLIITMAVNVVLIFFLVYRLIQLIRRYIVFRAKEVEKDKLMEEIAKLREQAEDLVKEKNKIFALKVGAGASLEGAFAESAASSSSEQRKDKKDSAAKENANKSRFTKLINLDAKYSEHPMVVVMSEKDYISLPEIIDRFVNFSASQLHLYYKHDVVRRFYAGMATSKIIILEGISGTGKTSLPYAMSKFFNNNASIVSVQPSWRDRAELIGYFNEFTKKFNETDFLSALYETTLRDDPNFIVLDEMNLARIEYYFADFLSIMEMPDVSEWKIDLVPSSQPTDPKNIVAGKILVPQNVWFIGTANNDDSTFTITDKVYDRAVALELNEKAPYFDAPMTENYPVTYDYIQSLFDAAQNEYKISDEMVRNLQELDEMIQQKFKIGFGNRIMKQIKLFVPAYMACGGQEIDALDFMVSTKILRKFSTLNLPFLTKELNDLIQYFDKKFGKGSFTYSQAYIRQLLRMA